MGRYPKCGSITAYHQNRGRVIIQRVFLPLKDHSYEELVFLGGIDKRRLEAQRGTEG
jgi:hypothetical protein